LVRLVSSPVLVIFNGDSSKTDHAPPGKEKITHPAPGKRSRSVMSGSRGSKGINERYLNPTETPAPAGGDARELNWENIR